MRQHPRPTYGKARGQWPPQLDKGDSSAQFHGQMESARRLSLTVEFSAPLRCVWQRVSLAREIFFMQGMKNGTECTLSRENETLPGAKPDSERNRYDPCTTERRRRPRRPPKRAGAKKAVQKTPTSRSGGQRGTSTWWYKVPAHGERARCNYVLHNAILLARAAGDRHPSSFAAYLLMGLPTMADFRPGGLRRFGASLRSQYRSCGVWPPLSFYADAWPVVGCTAAGDIGSTDCLFTCQRHYILQELAVVNPPPYPNATSRIIITVKPAAKASAPGPESPRVGSSSAATT